jgi:hypothetical protein
MIPKYSSIELLPIGGPGKNDPVPVMKVDILIPLGFGFGSGLSANRWKLHANIIGGV